MARFTGCLWCWVNIENCLMTILLLLLLNSWDGFIFMAFLSPNHPSVFILAILTTVACNVYLLMKDTVALCAMFRRNSVDIKEHS